MSCSIATLELSKNNKPIKLITAKLNNRSQLQLLSVGCALLSLKLQDNKQTIDPVLGYQNFADYLTNPDYMGIIIGRWSNRIANSKFIFNNQLIQLDANESNNQLHGGEHCIGFANWDVELIQNSSEEVKIQFYYYDQYHNGFPGAVEFFIDFTLQANSSHQTKLIINMVAKPDQPTPLNLTYHPYFNLNGFDYGNLDQHKFFINSQHIAQTNADNTPNGKIIDITNTHYDCYNGRLFTDFKHSNDKQIKKQKGLDTYYFKKDKQKKQIANISTLTNSLQLLISSNLPGAQVYTAGNLNSKAGKNDSLFRPNSAFCVEPHYPAACIFCEGIDYPNTVFDNQNYYHNWIEYSFNFRS